ncbi:MAG: ABC transporter ATP-binding protein [Patescibacteria group bacterium]
MNDPIIEVNNLSKKYIISRNLPYETLRDTVTDLAKKPFRLLRGQKKTKKEEFWALKDVNFSINQGERIGIIGRNGAGKSTLLKILSQITHPTSGEIKLRGKVASLLEVGTGFHPELTGRENIFLNGAILGMKQSEIRKKFDEIVAFAEIEKFIDTPVKRYSSGMYVRLAFAVAAHLEPDILIVDEVLAVGDSQFQKKCIGKMEEVGRGGRTVIFVSHNMDAITRLCNTVIYLVDGKIKYFGPTEQAIATYFKSDSGNTSRRTWSDINKAPSDNFVRLLSVSVHTENNKISESFDIRNKIGISMDYEVLEEGCIFTEGCNLFNAQGVNIFDSHDVTSDLRILPRHRGYYSSTMWIPGNFLSEGMHTVGVAILKHDPFTVHIQETNAVAFNVIDDIEGGSARGNYGGSFPGAVRPLLQWNTVRIK